MDDESTSPSTIEKLQSQRVAMSMNHHEQPEPAIALIDLAERIESVKAGLLGAATSGLVFGALTLVESWLRTPHSVFLTPSLIRADGFEIIISDAIAAFSGFLFGVTYRYIIRQDRNPHLRSGAVFAFGLVRGLALVEGRLDEPMVLQTLVSLGLESLLLFASVRFVLDGALVAGWLKPFGSSLPVTATAPLVELQPSSLYSSKSSNSN